MIKVIKYGKRYATCDKCKSILEFEDSDVRFADGQYKGIVECIDCPVCKNVIYDCYWENDLESTVRS